MYKKNKKCFCIFPETAERFFVSCQLSVKITLLQYLPRYKVQHDTKVVKKVVYLLSIFLNNLLSSLLACLIAVRWHRCVHTFTCNSI